MTHGELLELALLDALALLDEEESLAFDAAFRAAPAQVQAMIRREQTRCVNLDSLLPPVEAPAALRARVIQAVRAAVAEDLSPVDEVVRRLGHAASLDRLPEARGRRRSIAVWRAAALGCAAAAVVFGATTIQLQSQYVRLQESLSDDALIEQFRAAFGEDRFMEALLDSRTQRVTLASTNDAPDAPPAQAAVWYNPDWKSARLFGINLPPNQTFRLVVLDELGNEVEELARFNYEGGFINREVPVNVAVATDKLAIMGEQFSSPMLRAEVH